MTPGAEQDAHAAIEPVRSQIGSGALPVDLLLQLFFPPQQFQLLRIAGEERFEAEPPKQRVADRERCRPDRLRSRTRHGLR